MQVRTASPPAVVVDNTLGEQLEKSGVCNREIRQWHRAKALALIDKLMAEYIDFHEVPVDHPDLPFIRLYLGAYEDDVTVTDTVQLRKRLLDLCVVPSLSFHGLLKRVARRLSLPPPVFWLKIQTNTFTFLERRCLWRVVCELEQRYAHCEKKEHLPLE